MGVLFDLDLTLVNSLIADSLRKERKWQEVYALIPQFSLYIGIRELMIELSTKKIPICIVTSSPESYCKKVLKHFQWENIQTVCYHDTKEHKPHPEPIILGLSRLGINAEDAILVGDDPIDIMAAKSANVYSVGVLWGTRNRNALIKSQPNTLCETTIELKKILLGR